MKFHITIPVEIEYALTPAEAGEREVGTGLMLSPNVPSVCDIVSITIGDGLIKSGPRIDLYALDAEMRQDIIDACFKDWEDEAR